MLSVIAFVLSLTNQAPGDPRGDQFKDPLGATWKVFAVDSYPDGPLVISEVQELRQQNPPSTWAVSESGLPTSCRVTASCFS